MVRGSEVSRGSRYLLVGASLVVIIAGLRAAAAVLLPFMLAFFLAVLSLPLLNWLRDRRIPTVLAVLITVLAIFLVMVAIGLLVSGSIEGFTEQVPKYRARLQQMAKNMLEWLQGHGVEVSAWISPEMINPGSVMDLIGGTVKGVASVLSNILLVLLTMIFTLFEAARFPDKLRLALGHDRGPGRFNKVAREVQHYLGIKTIVSLATGILVGAWVAILGVDFPVLWGLVAFLFNYIPNLGSIIAAVPTILLALIQLGPGRALLVGLGYLVVNIVLGNFVEPHFMGRRLGLSTLVVFLSLVFWGWVWGPVGMLLSVPLTMIVKILMENTEDLQWVAVLLDSNPKRER